MKTTRAAFCSWWAGRLSVVSPTPHLVWWSSVREGGWAEEEVAFAVAKGFEPVGLGPRTLRTETAALAATAILEWLSQP